jgi:hypothetical protein
MPSHTNPAAPPLHSQEVPHPQSATDEAAVLIRQLCDHVPIEGIEQIIDGLRAERRRQSRDLVDVALDSRRQSRLNVDQDAQPNEEAASESIVLDSSMSIEHVTPPPSVNQDAPPPRYSRVN